MGEALEIVGGLPLILKMGWFVFAAWSVAQAAWYYRARVPAPVPVKTVRKRTRNSSARRPAVRASARPARAAETDRNSHELLASLGLLQTSGASQYGVPMSPSGQSGPTVIA
jgi:hypothetical protein